jgi:hypothetical protein
VSAQPASLRAVRTCVILPSSRADGSDRLLILPLKLSFLAKNRLYWAKGEVLQRQLRGQRRKAGPSPQVSRSPSVYSDARAVTIEHGRAG